MTALSLRSLRKVYKNGFEALKGIDLDVQPGDFFALLGPNGAGKSTTIGIISSLVNKTSGTVSVHGHDLERQREAAKRCIGLVPQEINFNQFETVENIVVNQAGYYGIPRREAKRNAARCLEQLDLWERRRDVSRTLSGGMKRRLMIARALVHSPRLLILDEPTAGVDIEIRRSMWEFLRTINRQGTTIILTTHYLEEAENLCRHIAIIDHGLIVEHSDMPTLLGKLTVTDFILELKNPLAALPELNGYRLERLDDRTLKASVPTALGINGLFAGLSAAGIEVSGLRNASNRLEQLFMGLVASHRPARAEQFTP
ncbi:MAG: ABC transporter ATP-binding protein [Methylococcaceae bacterium]|nr:ABC transporter ATP-binding protein [Methylococcaceae bacterium]